MNDRGAITVLMAIWTVILVFVAAAVVGVAQLMAARAQAIAAADAAALAAAPATFPGAGGSPVTEAAFFARLNGATLVDCRCPFDPRPWPRQVTVSVSVSVDAVVFGRRSIVASSAAEFDPVGYYLGYGRGPNAVRFPSGRFLAYGTGGGKS